VAVVWRGCSGGHGSNHGADHGNGFLIGGVVAWMQIPSCFVVSARVKCAKNGLLMKVQNKSHF